MKFVCPSCKAKYQIADERVAGRSVKMKCRKCGELIHISASLSVPAPADESGHTEEVPAVVPGVLSSAEHSGTAEASIGAKESSVAEPPPRAAMSEIGLAASADSHAVVAANELKSRPRGAGEASPAKPPRPPSATHPEPVKPPAGASSSAVQVPRAVAARPRTAAGGTVVPTKAPSVAGPPKPAPKPVPGGELAPGRAIARGGASGPGLPGAAKSPLAGAPLKPARPGSGQLSSKTGTPPSVVGSESHGPNASLASGDGAEPEALVSPSPVAPIVAPAVREIEAQVGFGTSDLGVAKDGPMFGPAVRADAASPNDDEFDDDERTVVAGNLSALAGAFSQAVKGSTASALSELSTPADDWYAGINGVPAGPMRLGELRAKASVGAITLETLVWRDGFDDWQPVSSFPELVAILEESISVARASAPPSPAMAGLPTGLGGQGPVVIRGFGEPGAPNWAGASSVTAAGSAVDAEREQVAGLPRRTSPAAWLAVGVALFFGLTLGFVFSGSTTPPETIIKYVEVPASNAPVVHAPIGEIPAPPQAHPSVEAPANAQALPSRVSSGGRTVEEPNRVAQTSPKGLDLQGLRTGGGPVAPGTEAAAGSGGQSLDSTQVQRTVSRYTGSVKRSCWQPALDSRDQDAPTTARVSIAITVGPSGTVENVTTSGDPKGYRGLANCIGARVRGWQFPATSGTTKVNVPFVFAAQ